MTFTPPSAARSIRIQGRVRTPGGIRAIYAMHIASADSGEAQRFEIGVKDIPDANVRAYLLAKYGEPDAAATSVEAASVVAELGQKLSPDTLLFWQFEHQGEPYLVYYARVGQRQLIGGTALKYAQH